MKFVGDDGGEVWGELPGPPLLNDESIEAIRLAMVCRFRSLGLSWRTVGKLMHEPVTTLKTKHDSLPPSLRESYAILSLRDLGL